MNYSVKTLDPSFNLQLLELADLRNTGSEDFVVDRSPDYFALGREFGETVTYGIMRKEKLVGCFSVSRQKRVVNGEIEDVFYLNDVRTHPEYATSSAFYRVIQSIIQLYQEQTTWLFSTILNTNTNASALTRGGRLFPRAKVLGRTLHVGVPMFLSRRGKLTSNVVRLPKENAWDTYQVLARNNNFAPMDPAIFFLENGYFLGIERKGKIVSVCKIVDQSAARKLISTQPLPLSYRLINGICRLKGSPTLPEKGEKFCHGYLAYYVSKDEDYRSDYLAYLSNHEYSSFTYVFMGLSEEERWKRKDPFCIQLSSTYYGYGQVPPGLTLDYRELTLI